MKFPPAHRKHCDRISHFVYRSIGNAYKLVLKAPGIELQFRELILELYQQIGMPVVVLIDEYDKRIIEHLRKGPQHLEIAKANRDVFKNFFGVLKGQSVSAKLRLVFLTGISRFSKVSIFSELNNLRDITMLPAYADMFGYTQKELETCFQPYIEQFGEKLALPVKQVTAGLAQMYNGYRFSKHNVRVYNPFSILNAFQNLDFGEYWFETATPTFLIDLLKQEQYVFPDIENLAMDQSMTTYDL
ncbi:MAG: AAA family ATPase [bacterium]|nr:AAA family ATPase [bacterium]